MKVVYLVASLIVFGSLMLGIANKNYTMFFGCLGASSITIGIIMAIIKTITYIDEQSN